MYLFIFSDQLPAPLRFLFHVLSAVECYKKRGQEGPWEKPEPGRQEDHGSGPRYCLQNGLHRAASTLTVGWGMDKQTSELLLQTSQMINNLGFLDNGISGINLNSAFVIVMHL